VTIKYKGLLTEYGIKVLLMQPAPKSVKNPASDLSNSEEIA